MAEYIASAIQTVAENGNVIFTDTVVDGCDLISHRADSGIVKLFPINGKCSTRFKITFGANIAVPTDGTVGPISLTLALDGEPITSTTAIVTPAAVNEYFNVFVSAYVYVSHCCCSTVAVQNTSGIAIDVQNANLIVSRDKGGC